MVSRVYNFICNFHGIYVLKLWLQNLQCEELRAPLKQFTPSNQNYINHVFSTWIRMSPHDFCQMDLSLSGAFSRWGHQLLILDKRIICLHIYCDYILANFIVLRNDMTLSNFYKVGFAVTAPTQFHTREILNYSDIFNF